MECSRAASSGKLSPALFQRVHRVLSKAGPLQPRRPHRPESRQTVDPRRQAEIPGHRWSLETVAGIRLDEKRSRKAERVKLGAEWNQEDSWQTFRRLGRLQDDRRSSTQLGMSAASGKVDPVNLSMPHHSGSSYLNTAQLSVVSSCQASSSWARSSGSSRSPRGTSKTPPCVSISARADLA